MIIFVYIFCLTTVITFALSVYFIFVKYKPKATDKEKNTTIKIVSLFLLSGCSYIITITLSHTNDLIVNPITNLKDFKDLGPYGDLIGGIMNPVIAFVGIIAASLAFYVQYIANKQVQQQFKIQQFESQFYEMLHLHRENLNEMNIEGYVFEYNNNDKSIAAKISSKKEKITSGKKVFVTMLKEFEAIHLICTKVFMFKFNSLTPAQKEQIKSLLKQFIFDHSYFVFFNGISSYNKNIDRYIETDTTGFLNLVLEDFVKELKLKRKSHEDVGIKEYHLYYTTGSVLNDNILTRSLMLSFNYKPFSGHQSILAHYYRHLFQIVKFVTKQDESIISYESKRDYLRILRSMMSNQEQVLIFYNWYGGFGKQWENNVNKFFTDYRMIHNLYNDLLIPDIKLEGIFDLNGDFRKEKNRVKDPLFEFEDWR